VKKLCVVIPALNEENLISSTLDSLANQINKDFSVIVVDNGSTDKTRTIIGEYSKHSNYPLILVEENKTGVGYARSKGSQEALKIGALFIAGTDADTILPSDWTESIYEGFNNSGCDLLCGECDPMNKVHFSGQQISFVLNARSILFKQVKPYFRGANYAITAKIFRKVGEIKQPLNKNSEPAPGEDGLFEIAALRKGARICGCLATVFPHPRRYISNLQKITEFKGQVHEGGAVTQIRNEQSLEKLFGAIPLETINIFADKVSIGLFNEFVRDVYREPVLRKVYWENSLRFLKPFAREEIESDLTKSENEDYLWNKYKETFFKNIKQQLKV
jgi:glycosyltransferase involved in cell wall biosynthesis